VNPAALLDELADAGVTLSLNGNRLHYQTRPGVGIAPIADRIRNTKIQSRRCSPCSTSKTRSCRPRRWRPRPLIGSTTTTCGAAGTN
jgi:hypothetical protein